MPRIPTPLVVAVMLVSPSLLVAAVYLEDFLSGKPVYRPLGITRANVGEVDAPSGGVTIRVKAELGSGWLGPEDRRHFVDQLEKALAARTNDFTLQVVEVPGRRADFTFRVGSNVYGPYPAHRVVDGLQDAVQAHNMGLMRR